MLPKVALPVAAVAIYPAVAVADAVVVIAVAVAVVVMVVREDNEKLSCTCCHQAGSQHLWEARRAPQTRNHYTAYC